MRHSEETYRYVKRTLSMNIHINVKTQKHWPTSVNGLQEPEQSSLYHHDLRKLINHTYSSPDMKTSASPDSPLAALEFALSLLISNREP